jgi:putative tryptophan/tyrosine transport system substrate-binding protein
MNGISIPGETGSAATFRRRGFVVAAAVLVPLLGASASVAQPPRGTRRIGYLGTGSRTAGFHDALLHGLRELGWIEGRDITIEFRFADGQFERLPVLAAELVRLEVELIVAQPTPAAVAAKRATATIPIVMVNAGDPDRIGLVQSLARPGGNVTGTAFSVGLETIVKGLDLLREVLPRMRRLAVLSNPDNPGQAVAVADLKKAAATLGLQLVPLQVRGADDFARAFAEMTGQGAQALLVVAESMFIRHRVRLAELALQHRLPTMHGVRDNVDAGGLISYGPNLNHTSRRAAVFVDKILKGARPADLPVEQPTKFDLVVNLQTAKALGLTIPQSVLLRADEVIQ